MPEMIFRVRWPDASVSDCYSPSTVIQQHLQAGQSYPLPDFVARCHAALHEASARVQRKYGYACSSALDQLAQIEQRARQFDADDGAVVVVERID